MTTPEGAISLRAICSQHKISLISSNLNFLNSPYASKRARRGRFQLVTLTSGATTLLLAIAAIAFLRFMASCCLVRLERGEERIGGHLYDVLVKLSDGQELVLEDIHHEDIVFFRPMESRETTGWAMNATPHALQYLHSVQFFDIDNLLNQNTLEKDNLVTCTGASRYLKEKPSQLNSMAYEIEMKIGIIVNVKPGQQSRKVKETEAADCICDHYAAGGTTVICTNPTTPQRVRTISAAVKAYAYASPSTSGRSSVRNLDDAASSSGYSIGTPCFSSLDDTPVFSLKPTPLSSRNNTPRQSRRVYPDSPNSAQGNTSHLPRKWFPESPVSSECSTPQLRRDFSESPDFSYNNTPNLPRKWFPESPVTSECTTPQLKRDFSESPDFSYNNTPHLSKRILPKSPNFSQCNTPHLSKRIFPESPVLSPRNTPHLSSRIFPESPVLSPRNTPHLRRKWFPESPDSARTNTPHQSSRIFPEFPEFPDFPDFPDFSQTIKPHLSKRMITEFPDFPESPDISSNNTPQFSPNQSAKL